MCDKNCCCCCFKDERDCKKLVCAEDYIFNVDGWFWGDSLDKLNAQDVKLLEKYKIEEKDESNNAIVRYPGFSYLWQSPVEGCGFIIIKNCTNDKILWIVIDGVYYYYILFPKETTIISFENAKYIAVLNASFESAAYKASICATSNCC